MKEYPRLSDVSLQALQTTIRQPGILFVLLGADDGSKSQA